MIEHRNFNDVVADDPAPYSNVVLDETHVYLAGLVAADLIDGAEVMGDAGAEAKAVMDAVGALLRHVGLTYSDIVRVDIHLSSLDDMQAVNAVYEGYFEGTSYPARTTVEAARLVENSRVEITVMARRR
jgi:enamine deaminase RidA (YjgF/YER057c/UK114 family)